MSSSGEGFSLDRVFYALGYAMEKAEALVADSRPARPEAEEETAAPAEEPDRTVGKLPATPGAAAGAAIGAVAGGWVLARLLRPASVHWPRVVLAGIAGTVLADLAATLERREGADERPFPPGPDDLPRYAAGVATAAAYASLLYPRLPGSPLTRGLLFGALEAAASEAGGTFELLRRLSPQLAFPLESLASPGLPPGGPLAGVAFGVGLGLYRAGEEDGRE